MMRVIGTILLLILWPLYAIPILVALHYGHEFKGSQGWPVETIIGHWFSNPLRIAAQKVLSLGGSRC